MIARSLHLAALAAVVFASGVQAQQEQQQPVPMPAVPPSACVKPDLPPQQFAPSSGTTQIDNRRIERFNKEYRAYAACVNKYIDDTNKLATAALDAGKAQLQQLNALNDEIKERQGSK